MDSGFVVYDVRTGEILRTGYCPEDAVDLQASGEHEAVIADQDASDTRDYVVDGEIVERPALGPISQTAILADDADEAVLTGLPQPCTVRINGEPVTVGDGHLVFTASVAGTYVVEIDCWPYQAFRAEIVAS